MTARKPVAKSPLKRAAKADAKTSRKPANKSTAKVSTGGTPASHDAYLAKLPAEQRAALQSLRESWCGC